VCANRTPGIDGGSAITADAEDADAPVGAFADGRRWSRTRARPSDSFGPPPGPFFTAGTSIRRMTRVDVDRSERGKAWRPAADGSGVSRGTPSGRFDTKGSESLIGGADQGVRVVESFKGSESLKRINDSDPLKFLEIPEPPEAVEQRRGTSAAGGAPTAPGAIRGDPRPPRHRRPLPASTSLHDSAGPTARMRPEAVPKEIGIRYGARAAHYRRAVCVSQRRPAPAGLSAICVCR
jgi:hypothetical protein